MGKDDKKRKIMKTHDVDNDQFIHIKTQGFEATAKGWFGLSVFLAVLLTAAAVWSW